MNDIIFSKSFHFGTLCFDKYNHTDNRKGSPSHFFALMLKGKAKIVTDDNTVEIAEGDIFYIPDKCPYRSYWYGDPKIEFVSLGFSYLPNFDGKAYPVQIIHGVEQYRDELFVLGVAADAESIGRFYTLVSRLLPFMKSSDTCRSRVIISKVKEKLNESPFMTTSELARSLAVGEASLYSAFKKSSDVTLNELRNQIVLEKARELLINTNRTVEDICDTLRFSSASYFRKKFRRHFGVTPSEMRRQYKI